MDGESNSGGKLGMLALLVLPLLCGLFVVVGSGEKDAEDPNCLPDVPDPGGTIRAFTGSKSMPLVEGTYTISSGFGPRGGAMHRGVDMAAPMGTPIHAATDGTVQAAGPAIGFGNWIVLDASEHGQTLSTVYGHMFDHGVFVRAGQRVTAGQVIGTVGSAGESSGPHLHFEVWPGGRNRGSAIDPESWFVGASAPASEPATPSLGSEANVMLVSYAPGCGAPPGAGGLKAGSVPAEFEPWITKAATTCPEVTAPIIAAQLENESGFNVHAHNSRSGADGPSQFMPATWNTKAVDGDGDGDREARSIPDAVMSQAAYDCELVGIAREAMADGKIQGDLTELWLSMYNCGPAATMSSGGVCGNAETKSYVRNIPARAASVFAAPNPRTSAGIVAGGEFGANVVNGALRWQGTPYAWAGGDASGPTIGADHDAGTTGFDCSGLVLHAVATASGGQVILPHQSVAQLNDPRGQHIAVDAAQPGDIVFPAGSAPGHVAIFIGDGKIVEAPYSGGVVQISPLSSLGDNPSVRRFG